MSANEGQELLTIDEVAKKAKCCRRTVDRWRRDGKIPLRKLGRRWVILFEDWTEYVKNLPQEGQA